MLTFLHMETLKIAMIFFRFGAQTDRYKGFESESARCFCVLGCHISRADPLVNGGRGLFFDDGGSLRDSLPMREVIEKNYVPVL